MSPDETKHDLESNDAVANPKFYSRFLKDVDTRLVYLPLLVCCFLSGLTDGTIYKAYGSFVSMQTGNTIFVALGTSGYNNKPDGWARSLCSIGFFVIGSWTFAVFSRLLGGQRRGTQALSFLGQTVAVAVAASLIQSEVVASGGGDVDGDGGLTELAIIALLSFQAAGQIVASRSLRVSEVPTVVVTSLLCDLVSDPALLAGWRRRNHARDRRVAAFALTLVGAVCGGAIAKAAADADAALEPALWTVAGIKFLLAVGWLFWPEKAS